MNVSGNKRSAESKEKICNAMLVLMEELPLEKINVSLVCKKADVNRSTFYAHYEDIFSLLESLEKQILEPFALKNLSGNAKTAPNIFGAENFLQFLKHFRKNHSFYKTFFSSVDQNKWIEENSNLMQKQIIEPYLKTAGHYTAEEYDYQYEFCKTGFFGVLKKWLNGGCKESDAVIANLLEKVLTKCLG